MQQTKDKNKKITPIKKGQKNPLVESYIAGVILLFITLDIRLNVELIPSANPSSCPLNQYDIAVT